MNNPSDDKCPKCGNPYLRTHKYNYNYCIYVHKQTEDSRGLIGLIKFCIVATDHIYEWPEVNNIIVKLNPKYKTSKPSE